MIVAQISDLHIGGKGTLACERFDTGAHLARCVAHLRALRPQPDVVLATGDLVNNGGAGEYSVLRELLAPLPMPVYVIPGNHDERGALCNAFPDHAYLPRPGAPVHYVVEDLPVRLIGLDTVVPGATGGALDAAQLDWLDAQLAAQGDRATLIFMHHPPVASGIRSMDAIALDAQSAANLGAVVSRYRHVELITCGHVHRAFQARWHGTTVSVCPSTAFQGVLDFAAERYNICGDEPPAYQVHYWSGSELLTHTIAVSR
jgi:Icc protein